jgi:flagellar biogenesis protein FliO
VSPLGRYVVETLVMLLGVAALAVFVLVLGRRIGIGRAQGPLELVGRLPLDARRAVYLVRVGKRVLILGASEGGLRKLGEAASGEIDLSASRPPQSFGDVLKQLRGDRARSVAPEPISTKKDEA